MLLQLEVQQTTQIDIDVDFPLYFVDIQKDEEDGFLEHTHVCIEYSDGKYTTTDITYELFNRNYQYESYNISHSTADKLSRYEMSKLASWLINNENHSSAEDFSNALVNAILFLETTNVP